MSTRTAIASVGHEADLATGGGYTVAVGVPGAARDAAVTTGADTHRIGTGETHISARTAVAGIGRRLDLATVECTAIAVQEPGVADEAAHATRADRCAVRTRRAGNATPTTVGDRVEVGAQAAAERLAGSAPARAA